jgi:serine protease AprX
VLTVGAIDTHGTATRSDDTVATFSARGPTRYDLVAKPDILAPGVHIVSAEAEGSYLSRAFREHHVTGNGRGAYMQLSGTSMSAAVVSGAVALLLEGSRTMKPVDVKTAVRLTGRSLPAASLLTGGAGGLNAFAAAISIHRLFVNQPAGTESDAIETTNTFSAPPDLTNRVF